MGRPKSRKKASRTLPRIVTWIAAAGVVTLVVYAASEMSGVAYGEREIAVVDFSALTSSEKRTALREANRTRCPCTCRMNLAQCVATDSTCPLREENIRKIRTMVERADRP
jgi:hypothetical protein